MLCTISKRTSTDHLVVLSVSWLILNCSLKTETTRAIGNLDQQIQEQEKLRQHARTILSLIQQIKGQLIKLRPTMTDEANQTLRVRHRFCILSSQSSSCRESTMSWRSARSYSIKPWIITDVNMDTCRKISTRWSHVSSKTWPKCALVSKRKKSNYTPTMSHGMNSRISWRTFWQRFNWSRHGSINRAVSTSDRISIYSKSDCNKGIDLIFNRVFCRISADKCKIIEHRLIVFKSSSPLFRNNWPTRVNVTEFDIVSTTSHVDGHSSNKIWSAEKRRWRKWRLWQTHSSIFIHLQNDGWDKHEICSMIWTMRRMSNCSINWFLEERQPCSSIRIISISCNAWELVWTDWFKATKHPKQLRR